MRKRITSMASGAIGAFVTLVLLGANVPGARLARGYIFRGDSSGNATAYDANDSGKILVGDGTDLVSVAVSGDATLSSAGVVSLASANIVAADIASNTITRALMQQEIVEPFDYGASKGIFANQYDGTIADGSTGVVNTLYTQRGNRIAYAALGAGQTITAPTMAAGGLDITGDQADNEGFELYGAMDGATGKMFTPGVDGAFQFCATLTVTDVSDTDELHVGLRKPEVTNATFANYDTYASIGINASAATAAIVTQTEDDGGGQTATTLVATWADAATKVLCVKVDAARAVTYTINGSTDAQAVAFSFDAGEPLIPYIWFLHAGAADCVPVLSNWTYGLQ